MKKLITILGMLSMMSTVAMAADKTVQKEQDSIKQAQHMQALNDLREKFGPGQELQFFQNFNEWQVQGSSVKFNAIETSVDDSPSGNAKRTFEMLTTLCQPLSIRIAFRDGNTFYACYSK